MRLSIADVLAYLKSEGLAPGGVDDAVRSALANELSDEMPWHVRAAVAVGAWVATAFLFGAVFVIAELEEPVARAVVGGLLVAAAVAVRRRARAEFLRQAAVAGCLAGQALIIAGVGQKPDSALGASVTCVLLSVVLLWLMPDRVHRFLSAFIGAGAAAVAAVAAELPAGLEIATLALVSCTAYVW